MKQVENYKKYLAHSQPDARDTVDSCWKHQQRKSQSFPLGRCSKNPESPANYYSSTTSYKPQWGHMCSSPTYSKCSSFHSPDAAYLQGRSKTNRDKHHLPGFSPKRKTHYDDELGDIEKLKFIDEQLGNLVEDNAEEEVEEEVTEDDHEGASKFLDKDYEEQEADDEIDDESEPSPQARRTQRASKNEAPLRQQRWRAVEPQPDTRRLRCQQRVALVQNHPSSPRFYHNVAEREIPEPLSEEDFVRTSLKCSPRRQSTDYRQWSPRNEADRYDDVSPSTQLTRRARTKPDVDRLMESELNRTRRCNRCGSLSSKRNEQPRKNSCRFDNANITFKGPIGDEPESHELYCGHCNLRYSAKDASGATNIPSVLYPTKPRRSREGKSSTIYEVPEQSQDKLSTDYTRLSSKYQRKPTEGFTEKPKRSLHTSHGAARIPSRYVE
ncbi:PREDICTED: uncharacterized protein LOC108554908 [Eufriesea mexicana]|uniref:uncharacterized protein LOC108554908 n=1 Tax=Eufriesea mexicana TaxID=516756 RepID=UPI00083C3D66|nr:PREDICTED: uncharacterized protein LOC108554908 [Eufriesea mexicana]